MSRIYEALQNAREVRSKNGMSSGDALSEMELPERRKSPRRELDVELTVYGRDTDEAPFYARASALNGSADGGLFLLGVHVLEGQVLLLINNRTSEEQMGSVVRVKILDEQMSEVSVSFVSANEEFWQIPAANAAAKLISR